MILQVNVDRKAFFAGPPGAGGGPTATLLIANSNRRKLEFHRVDCDRVAKIAPARRGFIAAPLQSVLAFYQDGELADSTIANLLERGYDGCFYCMPERHRK